MSITKYMMIIVTEVLHRNRDSDRRDSDRRGRAEGLWPAAWMKESRKGGEGQRA